MIVALNRGRGEDRRESGAVRQCGRGTATQVRHATGESDSISDGFPQDPVSLAAENSCTNRIIRTICPPRQFIKFMSTNEINSMGRGVETYDLHSSCAFFVKVDYFRFASELPIRRAHARTRRRTKARHCVILRLVK